MEPGFSRLPRRTLTKQHLGRFRCIQTRSKKGILHCTYSRSLSANDLQPVCVGGTKSPRKFRSRMKSKQTRIILCTQIRNDIRPEQRFSPTFDLISAQIMPV